MNKLVIAAFTLALAVAPAAATDWTGVQLTMPPITGVTPGSTFGGGVKSVVTPIGGPSTSNPDVVPQGVTAADSNFYIFGTGYFADPNSPTGVSRLEAYIPLYDFATGASVNASFAALSQQLALQAQQTNAAFAAMNQQIAHQTNEGIAEALAMSGTADLQSDETYAVAFNLGTFGGQTAFAAGAAARVADHVSISAGFTSGVHGRAVGGRTGIRFGW